MSIFRIILLSIYIIISEQYILNPKVKSDVFDKGENNYFCIKIPYLFQTKKNTLIALGEARKGSCSDYAPTDLVFKRSTDGGKTWSKIGIIYSTTNSVIGNAAPVVLEDNKILIPFNQNNQIPLITESNDDGLTYSTPKIMENATKSEWKWIGFGPPASIQLKSGRIIIPAYHAFFHNLDGTFTQGHVVYSDDLGKSWAINGYMESTSFPNECQANEIDKNEVVVIARGLYRSKVRSISTDGGMTFKSQTIDLPQPLDGCEGSTIWLPDQKILLFSGLDDRNLLGYRYKLTFYVSMDKGITWTKKQLINEGPSAYSSLVNLGSGRIGVLYEWSTQSKQIFEPEHFTYAEYHIDDIMEA